MDIVEEAFEKVKINWDETYAQTREHIRAIEQYDNSTEFSGEKISLQRLKALTQDGLNLLQSLQLQLDLLAPQLMPDEKTQFAISLLESWKQQYQRLRMNFRGANLQAKANLTKAAQRERELLFGNGEESTIRRRNLETKTGMTSAAESITESLRSTRQLMVQEVERSTNTLMTLEESTRVLKKAEREYKGQQSLLARTRNLLNTMQRDDIIDKIILAAGVLFFSCAVLYVVSKRLGILKMQRMVRGAIKAGMGGEGVRLKMPMHDEL